MGPPPPRRMQPAARGDRPTTCFLAAVTCAAWRRMTARLGRAARRMGRPRWPRGCVTTWSARWSSSPCTWASGWACTGRWPPMARRPLRSWPAGPAPPSGTSGNGWSIRRASGLLEVDDPAAGPLERRYELPAAHVPVLADPDDVRYRAFNGIEIARAGRRLPELVEAFRSGGAPPALPWAPEGRADSNRAVFLNLLGTQWLPAHPGRATERLRSEPARAGGRPGLRRGLVEHRDGAGLPADPGGRFRPGPRRDRGRPPPRRAGRGIRAGDLRRHRHLRPGLVRPV